MKNIVIIFLGVLLIGIHVNAQTDAKEIIKKSREVAKISGMEALSTLKIFDAKGRERVRKTSMASRTFDNGRTEKRIIRFFSRTGVFGFFHSFGKSLASLSTSFFWVFFSFSDSLRR